MPDTPGVVLNHALTVNLAAGTMDHVVNDIGAPMSNPNTSIPSYLMR